MACPEVEFLVDKAVNVIISPRREMYNVLIKKDDRLLGEVLRYFDGRVKEHKEAFRGNFYLVKVVGFECPEVEKLKELGAINITLATKKKVMSVVIPKDDKKLDSIMDEFKGRVLGTKEAFRGLNYIVSIKV